MLLFQYCVVKSFVLMLYFVNTVKSLMFLLPLEKHITFVEKPKNQFS